jgi:hypothetical protein
MLPIKNGHGDADMTYWRPTPAGKVARKRRSGPQ